MRRRTTYACRVCGIEVTRLPKPGDRRLCLEHAVEWSTHWNTLVAELAEREWAEWLSTAKKAYRPPRIPPAPPEA